MSFESELRELVRSMVREELRAAGAILAAPDPRALRKIKGWDIKTLARESRVSATTISDIENGIVRDPMPETLNRLGRALGCGEVDYREAAARVPFAGKKRKPRAGV